MERKTGNIIYELSYKNVKNINIKIGSDFNVRVSAPAKIPPEKIDEMLLSKEQWIRSAIEKIRLRQNNKEESADVAEFDRAACLACFNELGEKLLPLCRSFLKAKPEIRVREMKSCWGVCHPKKNYISLNTRLMNKDAYLIEYVILHEYVHFLHPNHQKGFHDTMKALMPDYKERKKILNNLRTL